MHFDKALTVQFTLRGDRPCGDTFAELIAQVERLPPELRAAQALNFAAHLVELAAFEAAGSVESARVGDLIQTAAQLFEESADVASDRMLSMSDPKRGLQ